MSKIGAMALMATALVGFASLSTGKVWLDKEANALPDITEILYHNDTGNTLIMSKDGQVMQNFSARYHSHIPYAQIPQHVVQAFVSAEDQNFWSHSGVDYSAIVRAVISDMSHKHVIGASTITQQVIKNLVTGNERTYDRKIKEALLAIKAENTVGKKRIMEIYLNTIWFGYGAYGIEPAALAYFNKSVSELSIADAAFLASLPKGPALMDPITHPDRAKERRAYVLKRMLDDNSIDTKQYEEAISQPLPSPHKLDGAGQGNSWYTETIRRQLIREYGADLVYSKGAVIQSNQDAHIQEIADKALQKGLMAYDARHQWHGSWYGDQIPEHPENWEIGTVESCLNGKCRVNLNGISSDYAFPWRSLPGKGAHLFIDNGSIVEVPEANGAVIVMSAKDGKILSETGGFIRGSTLFDRATQSRRQPGSLIKPFVALDALSKGWHPDSAVLDLPVELDTGNGIWSPSADGGDGIGLIPLNKALALSRNMAFVRLANEIGFDTVNDTLLAFHIYDVPTNDMSVVLGSHEASLLDLVSAYARLANGGKDISPSFYNEVKDNQKVLWSLPVSFSEITLNNESVENLTPELHEMLQDVTEHGTAYTPFKNLKFPVMGKTGTSNNVYDSWFVGFTGNYVVGVHVGFDNPHSLGEHEFGSTVAAPIAADIFQQINIPSQ